MCGIISYFSQETKYNKDMKDILSQLISVDTLRGSHSTGIMADAGDNQSYWYKKAINGHDFVQLDTIQEMLMDYNKSRWIVAHNRAATFGQVNSNNAHPFEHGDITGVHNGTLINYKTLINKGGFDVDSEYIFAALAEGKTKDVIPKINGSFALLWHDALDDTMHFIRNKDRPYYFAKVKREKTMLGASEAKMLSWIANRNGVELEKITLPEAGYEYTFKLDSVQKPRRKKHVMYVPFASRYTPNKPRTNKPNQHVPDNNSQSRFRHGYNPNKTAQFYINRFDMYNGKNNKRGTLVCKTLLQEDLVVYAVETSKYILKDQWYEGLCVWKDSKSDLLTVDVNTIKKLPDEDVGTESPLKDEMWECISCHKDFKDDDVLFVDDSPVCIDCIDQYDISKNNVRDINGDEQ